MRLIDKKIFSILGVLLCFCMFSFATVSAQSDKSDPTSSNFQIVPDKCFGKNSSPTIEAKDAGECGWRDLIVLLNVIIKFIAWIAASLSAIAFAYAGFLYMTAAGNSGKIEQAHGIFKKTLIGIFFILLGWLLVATVLKMLGVNEGFSLLDLSGVKELK